MGGDFASGLEEPTAPRILSQGPLDQDALLEELVLGLGLGAVQASGSMFERRRQQHAVDRSPTGDGSDNLNPKPSSPCLHYRVWSCVAFFFAISESLGPVNRVPRTPPPLTYPEEPALQVEEDEECGGLCSIT